MYDGSFLRAINCRSRLSLTDQIAWLSPKLNLALRRRKKKPLSSLPRCLSAYLQPSARLSPLVHGRLTTLQRSPRPSFPNKTSTPGSEPKLPVDGTSTMEYSGLALNPDLPPVFASVAILPWVVQGRSGSSPLSPASTRPRGKLSRQVRAS